jgi:hypothetical protein
LGVLWFSSVLLDRCLVDLKAGYDSFWVLQHVIVVRITSVLEELGSSFRVIGGRKFLQNVGRTIE